MGEPVQEVVQTTPGCGHGHALGTPLKVCAGPLLSFTIEIVGAESLEESRGGMGRVDAAPAGLIRTLGASRHVGHVSPPPAQAAP